jgi:hypothetical protein
MAMKALTLELAGVLVRFDHVALHILSIEKITNARTARMMMIATR